MKMINLDKVIVEYSLSKLLVNLKIFNEDSHMTYKLEIIDNDISSVVNIIFYSLEDVISFTNDVIDKCSLKEEVFDKYLSMFDRGFFRLSENDNSFQKKNISQKKLFKKM